MLLLLIILSLVGFVLSTAFHLLALFHIYYPPKELINVIYSCLFVLILVSAPVSKRKWKEAGIQNYKQAFMAAYPKWLTAVGGLLLLYVLFDIVMLLVRGFILKSLGPEIASSSCGKA